MLTTAATGSISGGVHLLSTRKDRGGRRRGNRARAGSTAQGATRNVTAGPPVKVAGVPKGSDSNAYFVKRVTIHVGDRVRWRINGFHTVTVPPKGDDPPPFIGQDASGTKISGVNDAAGNPFWFNGQTRITLTDEGALPQGGKPLQRQQAGLLGRPAAGRPAAPVHAAVHAQGDVQLLLHDPSGP